MAQTGSVTGFVQDAGGRPLPDAVVATLEPAFRTTTDSAGAFSLRALPAGAYTLEVAAPGFDPQFQAITVAADGTTNLRFRLTPRHRIGEVTVYGLTKAREASRQSYNITAIDAKKLYNTTLDISHALDRVSGVRVREDGGVSSRISFSLNGFTGRQVRFFLDGVPMDNFGSSFQINNIPINLAERVEVYKGVVPIWLGSDALGGAVNIVTGSQPRSYLDVSYSFGSFNTHRTTINAGYTAKSGFTAQLNLFQNYSDNNYWVHVDVADINTGKYYPDQRVRRFHDRYHNETVIANVGFVGKKWADQLLVGMTVGRNEKDIQTGARLVSVFGQYRTRGNMLMPHVKYIKSDLLTKGLDLRVTGNYNLGEEQNIDTANRRYNWFGDYKEMPGAGSERSRTLYRYRNNNALATATLSYKPGKQHSFMLNNSFNAFNRLGSDPLYPDDKKYEQPQYLTKNVLGLGYKYDFNEAWSTSVFVKQFMQTTRHGVSYNPTGNWGDVAYRQLQSSFATTGYGIASSYYLTRSTQLKGSYERSYRMPDNYELFGDLVNLDGNMALKPEMSDNVNVGVATQLHAGDAHGFSLSSNLTYRNVRDFIRPTLNTNQTKQVMENRDRVTNMGADAEVRYSYRKVVTAGISLAYQDLRNRTELEPGSSVTSVLYGDRIPNMPFLYGNADASLFLNDFGKKGNTLSIGYNCLYVHAYYLYWPSLGKDKLDIPQQLSHDLNAVYAMAGGKYNVALECRNVLDARLYDNFSLQKPGRSINVKLRYFISKAAR